MASNPQHEPTMEEILASIRKIISEDSAESPPAQPQPVTARPAAEPDENRRPPLGVGRFHENGDHGLRSHAVFGGDVGDRPARA